MEVVLGIGNEARPKACSSEIGSDKHEKTLEDNGVTVSDNLDDDKGKENVTETEDFNDSGVIEDCVMNGVSSLLKLKHNNLQDEKQVDEEEDEEHGYCVGDFVWSKIKNHPWWPGQIYDSSDASDLALKMKQKGKLLVAYFGDSTFAWCSPSQLKPFAESFHECSKISNSRGFLNAVKEAVEEIGKHIERLLICECAEENPKFVSVEAKNAGIKDGVFVRDVRREMISSLLVGKPGEILKDVVAIAESGRFSGLLELEVLKRKVSAFYRFERGYGLIEYHEPELVPGLEDKNDEDEEIFRRSVEKCSGFPDYRLQHRRKQKSIAEILENDSAAKVRLEVELVDSNVKSGMKSKGKTLTGKRKKMDEEGREESAHAEEITKIDIDSTSLASLLKTIRIEASKRPENGDTTTPKRERKKSKYFSSDYLSDFSWKGSKKSRIKSESSSHSQVADANDNLAEKEACEVAMENGLGNQEHSEEVSNAIDFLRLGATPEEMRDLIRVAALGTQYPKDSSSRDMVREFLSIYRSFTYHDGANSMLLGSYKETRKNPNEEEEEEEKTRKESKTKAEEEETRKKLKLKQQADEEEEEKTWKESKTKAEEEETRKKLKLKPQADEEDEEKTRKEFIKPKKTKAEEEETRKKLKSEEEKTRKKLESRQQADEEEEEKTRKESIKPKKTKAEEEETRKKLKAEEEETRKKLKAEEEETRKKLKAEEEEEKTLKEFIKPKKTKAEEAETRKNREGKSKFAGAELYVTFGPGSTLPNKEDLIEIYEKFGALDEERTYMFYNNFCARITFLNISDGEKAMESSQEKSPFSANSTVKFRLEKKVAETTMEIEYMKKKLEEMRSLVDESEVGMSKEVKRKLEDEMMNFLEKVKKMRFS